MGGRAGRLPTQAAASWLVPGGRESPLGLHPCVCEKGGGGGKEPANRRLAAGRCVRPPEPPAACRRCSPCRRARQAPKRYPLHARLHSGASEGAHDLSRPAGARQALKQFPLHKCGHEERCSAAECLLAQLGTWQGAWGPHGAWEHFTETAARSSWRVGRLGLAWAVRPPGSPRAASSLLLQSPSSFRGFRAYYYPK